MSYCPQSLFQRGDGQLPDFDFAVVPLDHYRSRLGIFRVKRPTCNAGNHSVVDDLCTVQDYGDAVGNDRYIEPLPLTCGLRGAHAGNCEAVEGSLAVDVQRPPLIVHDLDLVTAAQVKAAIASLAEPELQCHLEVHELLFRIYVVGPFAVYQDTILHTPPDRFALILTKPTCCVFAVEEFDRLPGFHFRRSPRPRRGANAGPGAGLLVPIGHSTLEAAIPDTRVVDHHIFLQVLALLVLETQRAVLDRHGRESKSGAAARLEQTLELAVIPGKVEPASPASRLADGRYRDVPLAEKIIIPGRRDTDTWR